MKLKSLLLGSAAVLVGVVGSQVAAKAADAIVVEPEPVEYVRICDAYGAGWFYIPGTETCLKFDGDIRIRYGFYEYHTESPDETSDHEFNYRARLNVRANNETEYGTLASRIRFSAENTAGSATNCATDAVTTTYGGHCDLVSASEGPGVAPTVVNWATISLAGFQIGFADHFWSRAGGYGFYEADADGPHGFNRALFFDYTWAANGWTATIGLSDGTGSGEAGAPDLYAGVSYAGSGWYLAGIYYNDSSADAGAWRVRADYDFGSNGFKVGGWYSSDDGDTDYVKGHAWGVTAKMNIADNMVLFGGYGAYADEYTCIAPAVGVTCVAEAATVDASFDTYTAGVAWNIVPGLLIQPEYSSTWYQQETAARRNFGKFLVTIVRSF